MRRQALDAAIAGVSLIGGRDEQQDAFAWHASGSRIVAAVSDGHGIDGAAAADHCATKVVAGLHGGLADATAFDTLFLEMHRDIAARHPASGATLTAFALEHGILHIAYVGDSEAWLCGDSMFLRLTVPHRYRDHRFEQRRIDGCSAISVQNGYLVLRDGSALAMTRALGDSDFDHYVLHAPEARTVAIEPGQKFLLVGSDGMWDALVRRDKHRRAACRALRNAHSAVEAIDRLLAELDRKTLHDNATLVVIDLRSWSARRVIV